MSFAYQYPAKGGGCALRCKIGFLHQVSWHLSMHVLGQDSVRQPSAEIMQPVQLTLLCYFVSMFVKSDVISLSLHHLT